MERPWILDYDTANCSIGAAVGIIGERQTFLVLREAFAFFSKLYYLIRHNDHAFGFLQFVIGLLNGCRHIFFHAPQIFLGLSQLSLARAHFRSAFAEIENIPVHVESEFAKIP